MAHYAFLDENNIVTEVIVGIDETELIEGKDPETWYGEFRGQRCVRTSYNAATNGFRKNYAGIGYSYSDDLDAFIAPQPFASWILDEETAQWIAPVAYPTDGLIYAWDEEALDWVATVFPSQGELE
jgi:hypothetical protein